jgi:hypothetical protein
MTKTMPYSKCPVCGTVTHLSVGDVQRWYTQYHPGVPFGELVPGRCFYCWSDLEAGMRIVVRQVLGSEAQSSLGARGVVQNLLTAPEDGTIYLVKLDTGEERYFIRAELRKEQEGEASATAPASRPSPGERRAVK